LITNKKIAVFSDIHGNYEALEVIINDIKKREINNIYCLGDIIGIGPKPKECLDLIIKNKVKMVLGNHELYYLKNTDIDNFMDKSEKEHHAWVKKQLTKKHKVFLNKCGLKLTEQIGKYNISFQHFLFNNMNSKYPFENIEIVNADNIDSI
jgi:predicted phosphodiesterase